MNRLDPDTERAWGMIAVLDISTRAISAWFDAARSVLARPPDHAERGCECWGRFSADQVSEFVAAQLYEQGPEPADIVRHGERFPADRYWWILHHSY